jgi:hypothetical protein
MKKHENKRWREDPDEKRNRKGKRVKFEEDFGDEDDEGGVEQPNDDDQGMSRPKQRGSGKNKSMSFDRTMLLI